MDHMEFLKSINVPIQYDRMIYSYRENICFFYGFLWVESVAKTTVQTHNGQGVN